MEPMTASRNFAARRRPTPYYSEANRRRKLNCYVCNAIVILLFILFLVDFRSSFSSSKLVQSWEERLLSYANYMEVSNSLAHSNTSISNATSAFQTAEGNGKSSSLHSMSNSNHSNLENGADHSGKSSSDDPTSTALQDSESSTWNYGDNEKESDESLMTAIDLNERYLYYPRCGDWCKGISHHRWSMLCMLGEALYLNRTLVFDTDFCIWEGHNKGHLRIRPIGMYYNLEGIKKSVRITPRLRFTKAWKVYNAMEHNPLTVKKVDKRYPSPRLLKDTSIIIWRDLGDSLSKDYAFQVCETRENSVIGKPFAAIWGFAPHLMSVLWAICDKLEWDFDAVHVRRGDKILDPIRWPNLDKDTRPESLLVKLPKKIEPGRTVYIATDERTPGFFKPLSKLYKVYTLDDFQYLWAKGSKWYNQSLIVMNLSPDSKIQPEFDAYMQGMIDYRLVELAKTKVETFNDLTNDLRHGLLRHS